LDRRDFLLFKSLKRRPTGRHYVLSCEWLYNRCLDRQVSQHGDMDKAIFDEEAIRLVFDDLHERFHDMDSVRVTRIEWLVGEVRKEFGTLMRDFKKRGGRLIFDRTEGQDPPLD
jgi:hypothetical protein